MPWGCVMINIASNFKKQEEKNLGKERRKCKENKFHNSKNEEQANFFHQKGNSICQGASFNFSFRVYNFTFSYLRIPPRNLFPSSFSQFTKRKQSEISFPTFYSFLHYCLRGGNIYFCAACMWWTYRRVNLKGKKKKSFLELHAIGSSARCSKISKNTFGSCLHFFNVFLSERKWDGKLLELNIAIIKIRRWNENLFLRKSLKEIKIQMNWRFES